MEVSAAALTSIRLELRMLLREHPPLSHIDL